MMAHLQARAEQDQPSEQPLVISMQRIVNELGFMVDHAVLLDQQIGQFTMQSAPLDPRALQGADKLRQELEGLQEFIRRLMETLGPDGLCSPDIAADTLKVRAQALRLRGLPPEAQSDDLW